VRLPLLEASELRPLQLTRSQDAPRFRAIRSLDRDLFVYPTLHSARQDGFSSLTKELSVSPATGALSVLEI
jgi:hypothetical protein